MPLLSLSVDSSSSLHGVGGGEQGGCPLCSSLEATGKKSEGITWRNYLTLAWAIGPGQGTGGFLSQSLQNHNSQVLPVVRSSEEGSSSGGVLQDSPLSQQWKETGVTEVSPGTVAVSSALGETLSGGVGAVPSPGQPTLSVLTLLGQEPAASASAGNPLGWMSGAGWGPLPIPRCPWPHEL